jgi:hypothetical protein
MRSHASDLPFEKRGNVPDEEKVLATGVRVPTEGVRNALGAAACLGNDGGGAARGL